MHERSSSPHQSTSARFSNLVHNGGWHRIGSQRTVSRTFPLRSARSFPTACLLPSVVRRPPPRRRPATDRSQTRIRPVANAGTVSWKPTSRRRTSPPRAATLWRRKGRRATFSCDCVPRPPRHRQASYARERRRGKWKRCRPPRARGDKPDGTRPTVLQYPREAALSGPSRGSGPSSTRPRRF